MHALTISKHKIAAVALLVFVVSHFLRAYGSSTGYECFLYCLEKETHPYYRGFVLTNSLFVPLALSVFLMRRFLNFRRFLALFIFLYTSSWFSVHSIEGAQQQTIEGLREIRHGYYLWLLAYGLLFWAHWTPDTSHIDPSEGSTR